MLPNGNAARPPATSLNPRNIVSGETVSQTLITIHSQNSGFLSVRPCNTCALHSQSWRMFTRASDQVKVLVRSHGGPRAGAHQSLRHPLAPETTPVALVFGSLVNHSPSRAVHSRCTVVLHLFCVVCVQSSNVCSAECSLHENAVRLVSACGPTPSCGTRMSLMVNTTFVSALHCEEPQTGTAARKTKEGRYLEFLGARARSTCGPGCRSWRKVLARNQWASRQARQSLCTE